MRTMAVTNSLRQVGDVSAKGIFCFSIKRHETHLTASKHVEMKTICAPSPRMDLLKEEDRMALEKSS